MYLMASPLAKVKRKRWRVFGGIVPLSDTDEHGKTLI